MIQELNALLKTSSHPILSCRDLFHLQCIAPISISLHNMCRKYLLSEHQLTSPLLSHFLTTSLLSHITSLPSTPISSPFPRTSHQASYHIPTNYLSLTYYISLNQLHIIHIIHIISLPSLHQLNIISLPSPHHLTISTISSSHRHLPPHYLSPTPAPTTSLQHLPLLPLPNASPKTPPIHPPTPPPTPPPNTSPQHLP